MSAPKHQHDDLFDKWVEWLALVEDDVSRLHANRRVWKDIVAMLESNDEIPEPDFIKRWITRQHMEAMAMGIRRQTEEKDDVVTLASLLEAIRRNPAVITRDRFTDLCSPHDDERWRLVVNKNFDKWAGPDGAAVDPGIVDERLNSLQETATNITDYVNKELAHAAKSKSGSGFTFKEVDSALDEVGCHLIDLHLLLTCASLTSPEPTIQTPWQRAFSVPWLPSEEVEKQARIRAFIASRKAL